jgi:hypothetical protein
MRVMIFVLLAFLLASLCGCAKHEEQPRVVLPQDLVEPTLAEQIAAVERGQSDRIHLIQGVVGDDDLPRIIALKALRELLLDNSQITSAGVEQLQSLPNLEHLRLRGRPLDDAALSAAAEIQSLRILNLPHGDFTDDGVKSLAKLPNLVQLRLGGKRLTDRALAEMMSFPALLRIHLLDAPITDEGLKAVHANKRLESLYLDGSQVTEQGLRDLFAALPELHVHIDQAHADFDPLKH